MRQVACLLLLTCGFAIGTARAQNSSGGSGTALKLKQSETVKEVRVRKADSRKQVAPASYAKPVKIGLTTTKSNVVVRKAEAQPARK